MEEDNPYVYSAFIFNGGLSIELWKYEEGYVDFKVVSRNDPDVFWFECLFRGSKDELVESIIGYAEGLHVEGVINLKMEPYWKTYLRDFM